MIAGNDGGPAFPNTDAGRYVVQSDGSTRYVCEAGGNGMTLRDWFAGQALSGLLASERVWIGEDGRARIAWQLADAMLAARERHAQAEEGPR